MLLLDISTAFTAAIAGLIVSLIWASMNKKATTKFLIDTEKDLPQLRLAPSFRFDWAWSTDELANFLEGMKNNTDELVDCKIDQYRRLSANQFLMVTKDARSFSQALSPKNLKILIELNGQTAQVFSDTLVAKFDWDIRNKAAMEFNAAFAAFLTTAMQPQIT
jgi:hypothetical protein